ncbi:sensor histidine kinase [uncultured Methylobacterium sp.]|uniref:sensor histidine kinase n=1 Tax=uncultured Methylobacterium sp. TaxID=157278 RepID=UPI0035CBF33D
MSAHPSILPPAATARKRQALHRFLDVPTVFRNWPLSARYAGSAAIVAAAAACGWGVWPEMRAYPFFFYFPAILLSAVLFGRGSGYVATGLSGLAVVASLHASGHLWIAPERDQVAVPMFLIIGLLQSVLIKQLRSAIDRARLAEQQKDLFLQEAVHRFRNDICIVSYLLRSGEIAIADPEAKAALANTANRVHVMSRVHDRLRLGAGTETVVDTQDFIAGLCDDLKDAMIGLRAISIRVASERQTLSHECAVAVGLIINEALTNALKYAFPNDRAGTVEVVFRRSGSSFLLQVNDDGIGMGQRSEPERGSGLGSRLLEGMARQLDGKLSVGPAATTSGTAVTVTFPIVARTA